MPPESLLIAETRQKKKPPLYSPSYQTTAHARARPRSRHDPFTPTNQVHKNFSKTTSTPPPLPPPPPSQAPQRVALGGQTRECDDGGLCEVSETLRSYFDVLEENHTLFSYIFPILDKHAGELTSASFALGVPWRPPPFRCLRLSDLRFPAAPNDEPHLSVKCETNTCLSLVQGLRSFWSSG